MGRGVNKISHSENTDSILRTGWEARLGDWARGRHSESQVVAENWQLALGKRVGFLFK